MQDFIDLANYMADEAGKIIRPYYRQAVEVDHKGDESPVTIADRSVEERLRAIIEEKRPEDGIIGEEFGNKESKNQYEWVLDPIDGTKSFVIGRPIFGTLIALCENNIPVLGIIDQPITKERWLGAQGQPTTLNGRIIATRKCPDLNQTRIASTAPTFLDQWQELQKACDFLSWGGDCYSYGLVANGGLDAVIETGLNAYDLAALPPIIEGAGGWIGNWQGEVLTSQSKNNVLAIGNPALKDRFIDLLS